ALGEGFHRLIGMRFHVRLVETEDQDCFLCAQALGDASSIHRGIATADNSDDTPKHRRATFIDLFKERNGVDHLSAIHCRDVEKVRDLRADCDEYGVEATLRHLGENVGDPVVPYDSCTHRLDARDLLADPIARQAVRGNAVSHHPAGFLAAVADLDLMPQPTQMVGAGQSPWAGADHQDALAGWSARWNRPTSFERKIAEKAIKRMDRHRLVEELAIAGAFAGMVAGTPVYSGKGVVLHVFVPSLFVSAGLRVRQPSLNIQAGRTG